MIKQFLAIALLGLLAVTNANAQHDEPPKKTDKPTKPVEHKPGKYRIDINIKGFAEKECYLGYHFGSKQYLMDTAQRGADGRYVFADNFALDPGIYLVVMPPKNRYFELLIDRDGQQFTIDTDTLNFVTNMKIKGSDDNKRFYDYLNFINDKRTSSDKDRAAFEKAKGAEKDAIKGKLDKVDGEVKAYQEGLIKNNPKSMTAMVMRSTQEPKIPDLKKPNGDVDTIKQVNFYREHYFDGFDLADERLIRTPILRGKVFRYIENCIVHHPDSMSQACIEIIEKARPNKETFKYWVTEFLNEYAASKIVGMDGIYVALGKKYYCTAPVQADWVEADVLESICKDVKALEPLLVGKIAPNIKMYRIKDDKKAEALTESDAISLHDVKSPYTILVFWDTECSHCQKSMPVIHDFYKKYKSQGIEVFAVCTPIYENYDRCWKMIQEKGWIDWINVGDPYIRSKYKIIYDIRSTPQFYFLDKDKRILTKKISAEQLEEVIPKVMEIDQKEKARKK